MSLKNLSRIPKNCLVVVLLTLGFLVILSNAACIENKMRRPSNMPKLDYCMENGEKRPLYSSWVRSDCMNCTCGASGMISCCSPLEPRSEGCIAVFDKATCTFTLKRSDNSNKECVPEMAM
ncbi:beta-microseminoprotein-like [Pelobates fuscus]|uniref:beta-microseminoprotein-like n=1 Tax=Pelobates fuscus TaxID=191477 RepID=UPI002FE46424